MIIYVNDTGRDNLTMIVRLRSCNSPAVWISKFRLCEPFVVYRGFEDLSGMEDDGVEGQIFVFLNEGRKRPIVAQLRISFAFLLFPACLLLCFDQVFHIEMQ